MDETQEAYDQLCFYTLAHGGSAFIHQHVVDAYAAQTAGEDDRPIKTTFALVGLYLHVVAGFNGRQVQLAHMKLRQTNQAWPIFSLPKARGTITVNEVLAVPPGAARNEMIHKWCTSVWDAFRQNQEAIASLLRKNKII